MTARRRRLAVRLCELVALLATAAAVLLLVQGGGGATPDRAGGQRSAAALDPNGDADHDGVPNGQDLQPFTPGAKAPPPAPVKIARAPRPDCQRKGITRKGGRQGTCTDAEGHRIKVVDRASLLSLKELDVRIAPIHVGKTLGTGRNRITADGMFVVVTATVHNKLRQTAQFRPDQMLLVLGHYSYVHDSSAEAVYPSSFAWTNGLIRAGHTRTGTVVFDVAPRDVRRLSRSGNVVIVQFSDPSYDAAYDTVGYFRTYR